MALHFREPDRPSLDQPDWEDDDDGATGWVMVFYACAVLLTFGIVGWLVWTIFS